jgi:capsular exopolysaccharide synthesis family protein
MPKTEKGKVIAVTSSSPGDGKTTTSINLAITFAQMGAKVLLMDCDLRKSRIHRYLQLEKKDGVTNVLCGFTEFDKAVKKNVRENLDCLTSGEVPPNPAELLGTEEFEKLISEISEKYDYVFIDTPPMAVVTDAAIVMKQSIGAVVVVRQNVTTFEVLDITMESIKKADTNILVVIMVGSDDKAKRYGYYKKGKYGYKYKNRSGYNYKYGDDIDEKM